MDKAGAKPGAVDFEDAALQVQFWRPSSSK